MVSFYSTRKMEDKKVQLEQEGGSSGLQGQQGNKDETSSLMHWQNHRVQKSSRNKHQGLNSGAFPTGHSWETETMLGEMSPMHAVDDPGYTAKSSFRDNRNRKIIKLSHHQSCRPHLPIPLAHSHTLRPGSGFSFYFFYQQNVTLAAFYISRLTT